MGLREGVDRWENNDESLRPDSSSGQAKTDAELRDQIERVQGEFPGYGYRRLGMPNLLISPPSPRLNKSVALFQQRQETGEC